ncbi:hypothetical protein CGZ80_00965 [Rhodopirellula sp. MGV]|nr:hypothetical protein CGZ80_00965 [Rhodopirellula sp. MGV]
MFCRAGQKTSRNYIPKCLQGLSYAADFADKQNNEREFSSSGKLLAAYAAKRGVRDAENTSWEARRCGADTANLNPQLARGRLIK